MALSVKSLSTKAKLPSQNNNSYTLYAAREMVIPKRKSVIIYTDVAILCPQNMSIRIIPYFVNDIFIMCSYTNEKGNVGIVVYNPTKTEVVIKAHSPIARFFVIVHEMLLPIMEVKEFSKKIPHHEPLNPSWCAWKMQFLLFATLLISFIWLTILYCPVFDTVLFAGFNNFPSSGYLHLA